MPKQECAKSDDIYCSMCELVISAAEIVCPRCVAASGPVGNSRQTEQVLSLAVAIGNAITKRESLADMLAGCASALVSCLDANLARIWVFNEGTKMLDLAASEGLFDIHEGPTDSVAIGDRNVGGIAKTKRPILTNNLADTLDLRDLEWITQNGMIAFAGHPLLVHGRLIGVMALLSTKPLASEALAALAAVADNIASAIERTRTEVLLRESQALFAQFADNTRDFLFLKRPGSNEFFYTNAKYGELFGRDQSELDANPFAFIDAIVPEDRDRMISHIETDQLGLEPTEIEYRIRRPDGELRWMSARTFPITNQAGELALRGGVVSDITKRKEAERRVSEFYSMVSHELRTPLTSIKAALGLLGGGQVGEISEEAADLVQIAMTEADRLVRLINDILDIRKIQAGRLTVSLRNLNALEIVSFTVASLRGLSREADVSLITLIGEDTAFIGDSDRVVQVLTNLLSNAIKVSSSTAEVTIAVTRRSDQFVRFSITDQGPGIASHEKAKVFEMFQQLDSSDSRPRGGSGLGLAISRAMVEQMGGTIDFDSVPGEGATFWFDLPAAQ